MISNAISCSLVPFLHRMHFLNTTDHNPLKRLVRITYFRFFLLPQTDSSEWIGKKTQAKRKTQRAHVPQMFNNYLLKLTLRLPKRLNEQSSIPCCLMLRGARGAHAAIPGSQAVTSWTWGVGWTSPQEIQLAFLHSLRSPRCQFSNWRLYYKEVGNSKNGLRCMWTLRQCQYPSVCR